MTNTAYCFVDEAIEGFTEINEGDGLRSVERIFYELHGARIAAIRFECGRRHHVVRTV